MGFLQKYNPLKSKLEIVLPSVAPTYVSAKVMQTGQTTSYRTGDDGDLQKGREVDFFTLKENNVFGNLNRFTDELGTQIYANDIVVDWSTYDGVEVLMYSRLFSSSQPIVIWDDAIDNSLALILGGYSGWHLTNVKEADNLINFEISLGGMFNYPPFNVADFGFIWTSNTITNDSTKGYYYRKIDGLRYPIAKTYFGMQYISCRYATVIGTTLT